MKLNAGSIIKATGGKLATGSEKKRVGSFSIDSRSIRAREAFIAIKGANYDGHDFIKEAHQKGVRFFIVDERIRLKSNLKESVLIKVKDTRKALSDIACFIRGLLQIPVVAVTGSNGKTTTKDMTAHILMSKYKVLKNKGTENNEIGLPLTLLKLNKKHNIAVLEMGMNHPGEIRNLNKIALANIGVITCIQPAHLQYLKSIDNIAKNKWELIESLTGERIAVLNNDDENIRKLLFQFNGRKITFGIKNKSDFKASDIKMDKKRIRFKVNRKQEFILNLIGEFNVYNALAAISIGRHFGIDYEEMREKLIKFKSPPMRMAQFEIGGVNLINDGYNANPASFIYAIQTLSNLANLAEEGNPAPRRWRGKSIIVCCDMLELGSQSRQLHEQVGRQIVSNKIDYLVTVGEKARWIYKGALKSGLSKERARHASSAEEVAGILKRLARPNDTILLKGSRQMKTEEIVKCFMNYFIR
jgi:UDP-N-acetylmuramoyl-tripeptide--D-alanyl-D-alanine ligase